MLNEQLNLKSKAVTGVKWAGASQAFRIAMQFVVLAVLARLLVPKDLGLIAMMTVFTNLVILFSDLGIAAAIVHRKDLTHEQLCSSFWAVIAAGLLSSLLLFVLSTVIAEFYNEPRLTSLLVVFSLNFLISSFGMIQFAIFTRVMDFRRLAIIEMSSVVISGGLAIILASLGFGVWSLVWQQLVSSFVTMVLRWSLSSWKPSLIFKWKSIRELLGYGLNLSGYQLVNYASRNLDNLLIGRFLGSVSLGYYDLAYRILLFPLSNISSVIGRVMFPSLSAVQDDLGTMRTLYLKAILLISMLTFPLMMTLLVLAPDLIILVFGEKWNRTVVLVQVFAIVGLVQSLGSLNGSIYQSRGRTDLQFGVGTAFAVVTIVAILIGLRWDLEGVAVAYAIASLLLAFPGFVIAFRLIDLTLLEFIQQLVPVIISSLSMGFVMLASTFTLRGLFSLPGVVLTLISLTMGSLCFISMLLFFDRKSCQAVMQVLGFLRPYWEVSRQ